MSELELKFQARPQQRDALLKALGNRKLERITLSARYFDTPDHLLGRHKMALRLRNENGQWVQTLKASRPHSLERLEHEVQLPSGLASGSSAPELVLDRHAGTDVGRQLQALLADHGHPVLVELYRTEVGRIRRLLRAHGALVEWSLDEGAVTAGERTRPLCELELELKGGDAQGLYAMAHEWQSRHGLWLDTISKAQRGSLLVAHQAFAPAVQAQAPTWDRKAARLMSGAAMLRAFVAACLSQILPNASEIAGGSVDPEHVHQLRVGLRRLRSAARELDEFAQGMEPGWEVPLRAVFDVLGSVRDRQVFLASLAPRLEQAGAPVIEPETGSGVDEGAPAERVRGAPFQDALLRLLAFAQAGDGETPGAGPAASSSATNPLAHLRKRLGHLMQQVTRDADRFEAMAFEEQHRVRKRLKRVRYVAALLAPLFKSRDVDAWLKLVKPALDALGRHIDLLQATRRFETATASDPRAWFAVGWLRAQAVESARASRKALQRLRRADAFW